ncbi:hypothetical protein [Pseudomonas jessenii]|uniref:hypothetical protein n=1 Tax=Pseudomonas jessenii TaxID=77298 RepID=UPI0030C2F127
MKSCAYCGLVGVMTKEHIWAASLIRKFNDLLTYNKNTNKFYKGEAVVKDVCGECNNLVLGSLDEYMSGLFDRCFQRFLDPGDSAVLEYDYDLLLRTLLKISYNAARSVANEKAVKHHKRFVRYIMDGTHRGSIMLRLQVVTSSRQVDLEGNDLGALNPEVLRCGTVPYDGVLSERFMVRLVAINCFWFYVIFPYKNESEHKWKAFLKGFSEWRGMPSGVLVSSASKSLVIPSDKTTFFHPVLMEGLRGVERQGG